MATWAVGDIQGCYRAFRCLLDKLEFNPSRDRLWIAGDLVNRGTESLDCLRFVVNELADCTDMVLGNHDLHLLAVASGAQKVKRKDTITDILEAPDRDKLLAWLRRCPIMVADEQRKIMMTHAGVPHIWDWRTARELATELESVLRGKRFEKFMAAMYGNEPAVWAGDLQGTDRWRVITNYFTRMRFVSSAAALDLTNKLGPDLAPAGFQPWFSYPRPDNWRVIFGHWAALEGNTGDPRFIGVDTGCVWQGKLTAWNLDTEQFVRCNCDHDG